MKHARIHGTLDRQEKRDDITVITQQFPKVF